MSLIRIANPNEIDDKKIMAIYEESNLKNARVFFPTITDEVSALEKSNEAHCKYLKEEFLTGDNICYVYEEQGIWVSALRLYLIEKNVYFLEALETMPSQRKRGYGAKLLSAVTEDLKCHGNFKIVDYVYKENVASLKTHLKCGFKIVGETGFDYMQHENYENCYDLEYEFKI